MAMMQTGFLAEAVDEEGSAMGEEGEERDGPCREIETPRAAIKGRGSPVSVLCHTTSTSSPAPPCYCDPSVLSLPSPWTTISSFSAWYPPFLPVNLLIHILLTLQ